MSVPLKLLVTVKMNFCHAIAPVPFVPTVNLDTTCVPVLSTVVGSATFVIVGTALYTYITLPAGLATVSVTAAEVPCELRAVAAVKVVRIEAPALPAPVPTELN